MVEQLSKAPAARRTRLNFLDIALFSFLMACAASSGRPIEAFRMRLSAL